VIDVCVCVCGSSNIFKLLFLQFLSDSQELGTHDL